MKKTIISAVLILFIGMSQTQGQFFLSNIPSVSQAMETLPDDMKIIPSGGYASSYQNGWNIENSYDGNYSSEYYSNWGGTTFPVTLRYDFTNVEQIDYLIYCPRRSGYNGNFKEIEIWYTTENSVRTKYGDFDFKGSNSDTKIVFENPLIKPESIEFVVKSGVSNYASCSEMEFYCSNIVKQLSLDEIFADNLLTTLKSGVTQNQINQIPNQFFRDIATSVYSGYYPFEYRVNSFNAYLDIDSFKQKVKVDTYSKYENPTGIYFPKGKHIVVAENIRQETPVYLVIPDFKYTEGGKALKSSKFQLNNGINIINITAWDGLGYISFFSPTPNEEAPVRIHFMKGHVHGMFDISRHNNADWNKILKNATRYHVLDVIGERSHIIYPVESYKKYAWSKGVELVNVYDSIVMYEQRFFGWEKYDKQIKNHMLWRVNYDYYAYKDGDGCSFEASYMNSFVNPNMLNQMDKYESWTTVHELGHAHQFDLYKWHGMTEVSVNLPNIDMMHRRQYTTTRYPESNYETAYEAIVVQGNSHAGCPEYYSGVQNIYLKLVPFAQLYHYFMEKNIPDFYPDLFEALRNSTVNTTGWGMADYEMHFIKKACEVSGLNLVPFFEKWGFIYYTDNGRTTFEVGDYGGSVVYSLSKATADAFKAEIRSKGYADPDIDISLVKPNGGRIIR